jgi:hypothetical protein
MSALGHKQTYAVQKAMSALPPRADMCSAIHHVCFGPIADITLFDHFVSTGDQRGGNSEAERLCSSEIDCQLVFCRGLHR